MTAWQRRLRTIAVGVVVVLSLGGMAPPAGAATGDVTEFSLPSVPSLPQGIAVGDDGALWFAERTANAIGRLEDGSFTEYPLPTAGVTPFWVTAGPDGNLWFTERAGNRIGRITTDGVITEFAIPTPSSQPAAISTGPDGALWFAEQTGNRIGRITTAGAIAEFVAPKANSGPFGITAGPDGNVWFTEQTGNRIGRITTAGAIAEFPLTLAGRLPSDITAGADGNLWFSERGGNAIGRISPDGHLDEFVVPARLPNVMGVAPGPDGNVWFTEVGANNIGRVTPDGTITEFPLPNPGSQPFAIARGSDDAMWFTEQSGERIGRMAVTTGPLPDTTAPTIAIATPAAGSIFTVGQVVHADYECADELGGSGLVACDGSVPNGQAIDTSVGAHSFTVTAVDAAGNQTEESTSYVAQPPPDTTAPTISIATPAANSVFTVGLVVLADYACADEPGGSGLVACDGTVGFGAPIDTSLGGHSFTVTAVDAAGNEAEGSASYAALGDVSGSMRPVPTRNDANAGSALTVSFNLGPGIGTLRTKPGGPQGRPGGHGSQMPAGLFVAGAPVTRAVDCADPSVEIGPTSTPSVDVQVDKNGQFHLVWKSEKSWAGSCRTLTLRFDLAGWQGSAITFLVRFR